MVVATDRYVAEDAAELVSVTYEPLPAVVGVAAARAAEHLVHDDVPGNIAADMVQAYGDAAAAIDGAPRVLELDLEVERSASMPMEGKGVHALGRRRPNAAGPHLHAGVDQRPGGIVRQARDPAGPDRGDRPRCGRRIRRQDRASVAGGGSVPWAAIRLGREVKWVEDRREHFVSSAHEREQFYRLRVGFDDDGIVLGLDVTIWHDHGAYTPYGLIVPINSSTAARAVQARCLSGGVLQPLHEHRHRDAVSRRRAPAGVFAMERTMDAIADELGLDRAEVRSRNFIQPHEMPWDYGLIFQDGRPLVYDSGDYPATLEKIKKLVGWDEFPRSAPRRRRTGAGSASASAATSKAPARGRTKEAGSRSTPTAAWRSRPDSPRRVRVTGRCSRRSWPTSSESRSTGCRDDGGHPPVRLRRRHVRIPGCRHERKRHRPRGAPGAGEGAADRRRRAGG